MKKHSLICLTLLLSIPLVACDNKPAPQTGLSTSTPSQTASKLDATAQFKQDYEAVVKWNNAETEKIQQHIVIMQKRLIEQQDPTKKITLEEATELVNNLKQTISQSIHELDALNIQDPDLSALASKMKEGNQLAQESFEIALTAASKPQEEALSYQSIYEEKLKALQHVNQAANELNKKVSEKYKSLVHQ